MRPATAPTGVGAGNHTPPSAMSAWSKPSAVVAPVPDTTTTTTTTSTGGGKAAGQNVPGQAVPWTSAAVKSPLASPPASSATPGTALAAAVDGSESARGGPASARPESRWAQRAVHDGVSIYSEQVPTNS